MPKLVYKLVPADEKIRKLERARKLWDAVLELTTIIVVFKVEPMDSPWNSKKINKLPKWELFLINLQMWISILWAN